jgi:hypothetical protein
LGRDLNAKRPERQRSSAARQDARLTVETIIGRAKKYDVVRMCFGPQSPPNPREWAQEREK